MAKGLLAVGEGPPPIIGHRAIWERLVAESRAPTGAYLFVGPRGVGKSLVARRFAERLVCPRGGDHADECSSCEKARAGGHPDIVDVSPAERQRIGVNDARRVVQRAARTPVESSRKVFTIDREMTEPAANALLKTLEEPTGSTVFILVSVSAEDFPATVASRCRTVHFGKVGTSELVEGLVRRGVERSEAEMVAEVAGGRPGMALQLSGEAPVAGFRSAWTEKAEQLAERDHLGAGQALAMVDEVLTQTERMLDRVRPSRSMKGGEREKAQRETRRQRRLLWVSGLEIMAGWFVEAAARELSGSDGESAEEVRRPSVEPARALRAADLVLEAGVELSRLNLRPRARLAELFCRLVSQ
ncbi:MAG: hypothetical protein F4Z41_01685 [Acidimicrobiia bacterium]|nr:hypothetical protein [Acidimicrobiia bacterium]